MKVASDGDSFCFLMHTLMCKCVIIRAKKKKKKAACKCKMIIQCVSLSETHEPNVYQETPRRNQQEY